MWFWFYNLLGSGLTVLKAIHLYSMHKDTYFNTVGHQQLVATISTDPGSSVEEGYLTLTGIASGDALATTTGILFFTSPNSLSPYL
ncbi:hypothetical protein GO730_21735 [Spirosoma sp. HMF3257]|uniref:Uncharacterized protein n=1 Tax=Spirosoma telluris TaxID=2183553 RepID=A0A327NLU5_9BACT|nr:hypothetical protein [Spirosoma telluris]RAI76137.1 hypothetical protein HMF3257_21655 [Spirosoma telluris]